MFCPQCGFPSENRRFCIECGAALLNTQVSSEPVAVAVNGPAVRPHQAVAGVGALIGQMLDQKYYLESKIGDGEMGTVYLARRMFIGDNATVKVLRPEQVRDAEAVERFRQEAQAASSLKHPNLAAIYDFGVSPDGLVYLVMEYVEGESLRQMITRERGLTERRAAEIVRQVCAALDEAHRSGVVHRDLKPENIVVQATSYGSNVKVLDLGLTAFNDLTAASTTQEGHLAGSPHYMSPEQCLGEDLDGRSDLYSLGIILYEMLAGSVPFDSETSSTISVQHVTQCPAPLCEQNPNISPEVESVVLKALEKRRELRPQTAGELWRNLISAINGEQIGGDRVGVKAEVPAGELSLVGEGAMASAGMFDTLTDGDKLLLTDDATTFVGPPSFTETPSFDGALYFGPPSYPVGPTSLVENPSYTESPSYTETESPSYTETPSYIEGFEKIGLDKKLQLVILGLLVLLIIAVGILLFLSSGKRAESASRTGAQNQAAPAKPAANRPAEAAKNRPAAVPAPAPSGPWEVITEQTTGVVDATNVFGAADEKMAVIEPGGQLAMVYREGQFFGDGPGADIRVYGPNQKRISYQISVRDKETVDWKRIDRNRRWFPKGVIDHDLGRQGVRSARQILIKNIGPVDLKIDAVTAVYKK